MASKTTIAKRLFGGTALAALGFGIWKMMNPATGRYGGLETLGYMMISGMVIVICLLALGLIAIIGWWRRRKEDHPPAADQ